MGRRMTWTEKLNAPKAPKREVLKKPFAGMPAGTTIFVATPQLIKAKVEAIPRGATRSQADLRRDFAAEQGCATTCPASTSIFLRVVAEAACEAMMAGAAPAEVTPFWRVVEPGSALADKLSCGSEFVALQRAAEGAAPPRAKARKAG
jgi:hypothetical protein